MLTRPQPPNPQYLLLLWAENVLRRSVGLLITLSRHVMALEVCKIIDSDMTVRA